jgi:NAD(P)-dependent dehydrogenase (short-subunit alcohol dehydrogenase family)
MILDETPTEVLESFEQGIPIGRLADPKEMAHLDAFLTSDEASHVGGATLDVNGVLAMP